MNPLLREALLRNIAQQRAVEAQEQHAEMPAGLPSMMAFLCGVATAAIIIGLLA